ncbi:SGNH/GDSL hydrolase family protein [Haloechinothrix salitolerans]|uniref:SGNH/GDSL hydrolase family protein n=1 Tax=Haloechinothrix salitolerans TaxID=926830 RepID=A0ABW2C2B7_9PSEU
MKTTTAARRVRIALTCVLAALLTAITAPSASASTYPSSMDALGDSITRAFNTCWFPFVDCVRNNWSTGTNSEVDSYYLRLTELNPDLRGNNHNDAVSGAVMADLDAQAADAVSRDVELVTILMGNNDACADTIDTMTSVSEFQSQFETAMSRLDNGIPNAEIKVASLPDIYQLWELFHDDSDAVSTWDAYDICQALLENPQSTDPADVERRETFRQRVIDYNTVLEDVCSQYSQCQFDGNAGFNTTFKERHVSTRDYFHPSVEGQTLLASVAWNSLGY